MLVGYMDPESLRGGSFRGCPDRIIEQVCLRIISLARFRVLPFSKGLQVLLQFYSGVGVSGFWNPSYRGFKLRLLG